MVNHRLIFMVTLACIISVSGCGIPNGNADSHIVESVTKTALSNQVFIEGGTFHLGDIGTKAGAPYVTLVSFSSPAVQVSIDSFSISRFETTWLEFRTYLEDTGRLRLYDVPPSLHKYTLVSDDPLSPHYSRKPAKSPNYYEAEGYCGWLANRTGLPFALPSEAQWEFAARSRGENLPYATDSGTIEKDPYLRPPQEYVDPSTPPSGNTLMHSSAKFERRPVGSYPPNPLGLYDMTGNVAEWTQDWFQEDFYKHAPHENPSGPAEPVSADKPEKTVRDWAGRGDHMGGSGTVFARAGRPVDTPDNGFRCVVNRTEPIEQ